MLRYGNNIKYRKTIIGMREKTKTDITRPPLTDILVKYFFELRRTCPNYWWKKVPVFFIEYSAGQGFFAHGIF